MIVAEFGNSRVKSYRINMKLVEWTMLPKTATVKKRSQVVTKNGNEVLPEMATKTLPNLVTKVLPKTATTKETLKESIKQTKQNKDAALAFSSSNDNAMQNIKHKEKCRQGGFLPEQFVPIKAVIDEIERKRNEENRRRLLADQAKQLGVETKPVGT
jgi:hypothetical protein